MDGAKKKKLCLSQRFSLLPLVLSLALLLSATLSVKSARADSSVAWQTDQITVHHPIEKVAPLLASCTDYRHLFKYVNKSRALATDQCYVEAKILKQRFWLHLQMGKPSVDADGKTIRYSARMVKGSIKVFHVKIKLVKLEDRKTLVIFRMLADPGMPVPNSLVEGQVKKVIHRALVKLSMRLLVGRY